MKQYRTNTMIFVAQTSNSDKTNNIEKKNEYHYTRFKKKILIDKRIKG